VIYDRVHKPSNPIDPTESIHRLKGANVEGPLSFFLFFFVVVPFVLINMTHYIKERRQADEDTQTLLKENNDLLRELIAKLN
jgi:hypothetical protein